MMRKNKLYTRGEKNRPLTSTKPTLLALAIAQALVFQATHAASIEVTSNLDDGTDCTLREALTTVNAGMDQLNGCVVNTGVNAVGTNDTVTFGPGVSGQTVTLTQGELQITKDVSVNPGGVNTTIDANQASRVMSVISNDAADLTVTLNQLTITEGNANGISVANHYSGPYEYNTASLTLTNSTVTGNTGDGISVDVNFFEYANLVLTNSTVSDNTGHGIFSSSNIASSSVDLTNSTISDNGAHGIYGYHRAHAHLTNSTVSGNYYDGVHMLYGTASLNNSTVSDNSVFGINAGGNGAGIHLANSIVANNGYGCVSGDPYGPIPITAGPDTISTNACGGATIADPLLGSLADNGGPTQTHALLAGSPAINNATAAGANAADQRGVAAVGVRDSGAYEFTGSLNALAIEKLINNRVSPTPDTAAQLLAGTRYRSDYKVTNKSPNRIYRVRVFEDGELVCNLYSLMPGQSKQPSYCANFNDVLDGLNNVPANVTAKVSGANEELTSQTNAYYTGFGNVAGKLKVTHYVNNRNADTQGSAATVNGNQAEILFRVENTGSIKLYRVKTYHDPASPVNSGWQKQCFIGTMMPGQVRYCKRTITVNENGLNKAFGRVQGQDANVSPIGYVNASNPTYFNVTGN